MKTIYDMAVETYEDDLLAELAEQLYFYCYPKPQYSYFQDRFNQAINVYYYIREKGCCISGKYPNIKVVSFCNKKTHRFYKDEKDYLLRNKEDKTVFKVDIIRPYRILMGYLIYCKKRGRKIDDTFVIDSLEYGLYRRNGYKVCSGS